MIRRLLRNWVIRALGAECVDPSAAARSVRQAMEEYQ